MEAKLTHKEYTEREGYDCPACGESEARTTSFAVPDSGCVQQNVTCDNCGSTWADVYELTHYVGLRDSKGNVVELPAPEENNTHKDYTYEWELTRVVDGTVELVNIEDADSVSVYRRPVEPDGDGLRMFD